ncbi:MAG: glycerate kinase [Candidatus Hydrogenedentes bacterium]|nr:glycerate kinase [Candidatus Hydrogenedentota bacterium]
MIARPFHVLIAPDSFKESMSAPEAAAAMAAGWSAGFPESTCRVLPMADGGEGTAEILRIALGGVALNRRVRGPLGAPVEARYTLLDSGKTAVIELAAASGLALAPPAQRDPFRASTYGTGELLRDALKRGAAQIILTLGGSATNDGGAGLAQALGLSLRDKAGCELAPGAAALANLHSVDASNLDPRLSQVTITIACDVTNPLCGPNGATRIYGPQKGVLPGQVEEMDRNLNHFGTLLEGLSGRSLCAIQGMGAAGGAALPLVAFALAKLESGFDLVARASRLEEAISEADLVLTGEGSMDRQSAQGKVISGILGLASHSDTGVVALAGQLGEGCDSLFALGLTAVFSIAPGPRSLDKLLAQAPQLIENRAFNVARCYRHAALRCPRSGPQ